MTVSFLEKGDIPAFRRDSPLLRLRCIYTFWTPRVPARLTVVRRTFSGIVPLAPLKQVQ